MAGDAGKLSFWDDHGSDRVQIDEDKFRPTSFEAGFVLDGQAFLVDAVGTEDGVTITRVGWDPAEDSVLPSFDLAAAAAVLEEAAVIEYRSWTEKPEIRLGAGQPFVPIQNVRRYLAGPTGPATKPGPKRRVAPNDVVKAWKAAKRKKISPTQHVAVVCKVSTATAQRYIADARKAGLLEEGR